MTPTLLIDVFQQPRPTRLYQVQRATAVELGFGAVVGRTGVVRLVEQVGAPGEGFGEQLGPVGKQQYRASAGARWTAEQLGSIAVDAVHAAPTIGVRRAQLRHLHG